MGCLRGSGMILDLMQQGPMTFWPVGSAWWVGEWEDIGSNAARPNGVLVNPHVDRFIENRNSSGSTDQLSIRGRSKASSGSKAEPD